MVVDDHCIGAINLYDQDPREWPADVLDIAGILADMASGYIVNARNLTAAQRIASQLQHALDTRVVVEQAKGILAERDGMDLAAAFDRIRKHARDGNKRVPAVARAIVEGRLRL